jgi:hypothetical protein
LVLHCMDLTAITHWLSSIACVFVAHSRVSDWLHGPQCETSLAASKIITL